jgi:hypothetical protein|tara:strand:+ start:4529 stop:5140 length:612 start_codon:yes stop_codon:yes gene_type:complete
MAERTYPNDYFAWYNDDTRLAILSLDTTSTSSSERTTEKYDTFQGDGNLSGTITDLDGSGSTATATDTSHGLATNDRITISGTTTYDGTYDVTVTDANTFTFSHTGSTSDETGTWVSLFIDNGLRITYKSKYETVSATTDNLETDIGLDSSLQPSLVCYLKSRLYEDQGSFEQANYFRQMYENQMMKQRSRKSGVRGLSVPNL